MSTTVVQQTTFHQLITNADNSLDALAKEQQAINARLAAIAHERATLAAQAQTRRIQLEQATRNAEQALARLDTVQAAARIAAGTSATQEPLEPLLEEASRLHSEKNRLVALDQLQADQDSAREQDLTLEETEGRLRLEEVARELTATARAKAEALADWGGHEHREAVADLTHAKATISELERQLQAARDAEQAVYETRLQALQQWPQHQADVRPMVPYEDAVTVTLTAALGYVDALLANGRQLPTTLNVNALAPYYHVFDELLRIKNDEIFGYQSVRDNPQWLRERRAIMAAVLAEYRETTQQKGQRP